MTDTTLLANSRSNRASRSRSDSCLPVFPASLVCLVACLLSVVSGQLPVVQNLDEVLGSDYMRISKDMCFEYNMHMGGYAQTTDMVSINSVFNTSVDFSDLQAGSVAQVTIHRNSYRAIEAQGQNKLAISIIYDKSKSDDFLSQYDAYDADTDIMVFLEIVGVHGSSTT